MKINIYSIFLSIDGEVNKYHQGRMTVFVRLAGCNIKCLYCDTKYARTKESGNLMEVEEVIEKIKVHGCKKITITGGEPLLQSIALGEMVKKLRDLDYKITIETNGTCPANIDGASYVMDWKLPSSGMERFMLFSNFLFLKKDDFVKFVVCDEVDLAQAIKIMSFLKEYGVLATFAFSPVFGQFSPAELFEKLEEHKILDVVVNLQLHKYIWPNVGEGQER